MMHFAIKIFLSVCKCVSIIIIFTVSHVKEITAYVKESLPKNYTCYLKCFAYSKGLFITLLLQDCQCLH